VVQCFAAKNWHRRPMATQFSVRALALVALLAILGVAGVSAMFQDEAGLYDWVKENVGPVRHAAFASKGKAAVVATEIGVLASLAVKSGAINWRRVLSEGTSRCASLQLACFATTDPVSRRLPCLWWLPLRVTH
jgi:hypothetical protein